MTTLREAAQQALEALELVTDLTNHDDEIYDAIDALRAALAEPVQEPVAWLFTNLQSGDYDFCYQEDEHDHDREMWHKQPLYTTPPQRKPLTDEEIYGMYSEPSSDAEMVEFARAVERAHGIGEKA